MDKFKRIGKWVGIVLAVIVVLLAGLFLAASVAWSGRLDARYETPEHDFEIPTLDDSNRAEAERLYLSRGCGECHMPDGGGRTLVDAPPFLATPPNVTGVMRSMTPPELHALIRRGIRRDGSPIFFMPSHEYQRMPDLELGLITAHVRSLPESDAEHPQSELRGLGRVLELVGVLDTVLIPAEVINQSAAPNPAGPDEMGEYLAAGCTGCHGAGLSGGPMPGAPEDAVGLPANITPHETGLGGWSQDDFVLAMREGQTPDGEINADFMPIGVYCHLNDDELAALWAHLQTCEPREFGNR